MTEIDVWRGQIRISLKKEYEQKLEENEEEFNDRSPTEVMYEAIDRIIENAPTPQERARKHRSKAEEHQEEAKKWERRAKKKNAKSEIRDKREKLGELENRIEVIEDRGLRTEKEIRKDIEQERRERGHDLESEEVQESIDRQVKKKLEKQPNLKQLKEERSDLKDQVSQLESILEVDE